MRVLVAGATGAIGRPLTAALNACGHMVTGLTRDHVNADLISELGAQPLVVNVLDRDATSSAVSDARPDVVVDQLTALPRTYTPATMRASLAATGEVRTTGGDNLYAAAVLAGARRYVAQSGCYYYRPGEGLASESETVGRARPATGCRRSALADGRRAAHAGPEQAIGGHRAPLRGLLRTRHLVPPWWRRRLATARRQLSRAREGHRYLVVHTHRRRRGRNSRRRRVRHHRRLQHLRRLADASRSLVTRIRPMRRRAAAAERSDRTGHRPGRPLLRRVASRGYQPPRPQGTRPRYATVTVALSDLHGA
jgi:hypothetical protein